MKYKETPLKDITAYISKGIVPKYASQNDTNIIRVLNQRCNRNNLISLSNSRFNNLDKRNVPNEKVLKENDVLINSTGVGTAGRVAQVNDLKEKMTVDGHMIIIRPTKTVNPVFYGYAVIANQYKIEQLAEGSTGQTEINRDRLLKDIYIKLPSLDIQNKIANNLRILDNKISLNNQINANLAEINKTVFSNFFANQNSITKASDIADIRIGKTPPRKQKKWFSLNGGYKWLSIKDMKRDGIFALHTEEFLTKEAIEKYNIQVVPKHTVMLSFKLTIGRVKISEENMVTNEAIAQFRNSKLPYEYLYTYLDNFSFETLGSTSSIAQAINSRIIKSMPILIPERDLLNKYLNFARPIFSKMLILQKENIKLNRLKQVLLDKYF